MNKYLKEALLRQKVRRAVKATTTKVLSEQEEYEAGSLYSTFVEPFTDVVQAVNLGAQDFLNSYVTYLRLWITWSPEKGKKLLQEHDERQAKIAEKWKPLMDRTETALSTGDADILALALAPQVFAISALGSAAANYSGDVKSLLDTAGLGGFVSGLIPGSKSDYKPEKDDDDLLSKVNKLFFAGVGLRNILALSRGEFDDASKNESKNILKEEKGPKAFKKDFGKFLEDTGVKAELDKTKKDLVDNLKSTIKKFDDDYEKREGLFNKLKAADTLEAFKQALSNLEKSPISENRKRLNEQALQKIASEIDSNVDILTKSEEFIETVKKETNKEDLTQEEVEAFAKKTVFLQSKKSLEKELGGFDKSLEKVRRDMGVQIKEMLPTPAGEKILKQAPESKQFLNFLEKTKQRFFIA